MTYSETTVEVLRLSREGCSHAEVARRMGISPQRVSQLLRPVREVAREFARRAVAAGDLVRPEVCDACGGAGPIDAHHDDYDKPLDVRWLCKPCHHRTHHGAPRVVLPNRSGVFGIACPTCGSECDGVVDTRRGRGHIRRRRVCGACGARTTTREVPMSQVEPAIR